MNPRVGSLGSWTWYTARGAAPTSGASAGRTAAWLSASTRFCAPRAATISPRVRPTAGVTVNPGPTDGGGGTADGMSDVAQPAARSASATDAAARWILPKPLPDLNPVAI